MKSPLQLWASLFPSGLKEGNDIMPARSSVTAGLSNSKVRYSKLAGDDEGYIDLQVRKETEDWLITLDDVTPDYKSKLTTPKIFPDF